jgi:hypothetical protein
MVPEMSEVLGESPEVAKEVLQQAELEEANHRCGIVGG